MHLLVCIVWGCMDTHVCGSEGDLGCQSFPLRCLRQSLLLFATVYCRLVHARRFVVGLDYYGYKDASSGQLLCGFQRSGPIKPGLLPTEPSPSPFGQIHLTLAFLDFVYSASVFPGLQATVNCLLPISHIQSPCTNRRHCACGHDAQSESIFLDGSFGLPAHLQTFGCVLKS